MQNIITNEEWNILITKKIEQDHVGKIEAKRLLTIEGFSKEL